MSRLGERVWEALGEVDRRYERLVLVVGPAADQVGRLLQLQRHVSAPQIQRRLAEQLGDRETVARCGQYVRRTFVDWGVLCDTAEKGVYVEAPAVEVQDPRLRGWLVESLLRGAGEEAIPLRAVAEAPSLFALELAGIHAADIGRTGRLEVFRQGLSKDVVTLRCQQDRRRRSAARI